MLIMKFKCTAKTSTWILQAIVKNILSQNGYNTSTIGGFDYSLLARQRGLIRLPLGPKHMSVA